MVLSPSPIGSNLLKVVVPLVAIGVIVFVVRRRRLSFRDTIGFRPPPPALAALWVAIYVAWMLGTNVVMNWRGPWEFAPWRDMPLAAAILRVLAVAILGPIGEEMMFRGLFQGILTPRIGVPLAIAIPSVVWAGMHYTEPPQIIALFVADGILLGLARHQTRSLYVPIAMHIIWNLYAVW